jgi:hypothetical protein
MKHAFAFVLATAASRPQLATVTCLFSDIGRGFQLAPKQKSDFRIWTVRSAPMLRDA